MCPTAMEGATDKEVDEYEQTLSDPQSKKDKSA
jgi:hypothetical protein